MASDKKEQKQRVTSDSRFKSVHNDPRFKAPSLKNFKVKVDERFSKDELKKLNKKGRGKGAQIDRYGRKLKSDDHSTFDKFYENEKNEKNEQEKEDKASDSSDSDSDSDSDSSPVVDRARGEGVSSSESDSDSSSDSDSDSDDSETGIVYDEEAEESEVELEEGKPEEGEPSASFAVVNLDWDNVRAVDLMVTFQSFVPKGGSIKSVTIYPSQFGKEQMQREEIEGPSRELFKSKKKKKKHESDESDDEVDMNNVESMRKITKKLYEEEDGTEDYDSKALRRYQLQRLRYYYAVVHCDSVSTAENIYKNCDGTEYESTANIFDLRYIPDGVTFEDDEPKDQCDTLPTNYKPSAAFVTDALQHSKVKLTWDETPKERLAVSSRPFSQKEIDEMDFKAYLASDSDSEDEKSSNKYKNLLGGTFDKSDSEDDVDMEITFTPGLDEQKPPEPAKEEEETTIDAYRRKEKERRKRRMEKLKKSEKTDENEAVDEERSKAELELLMMEEGEKQPQHFNMKEIVKAEKKKDKKSRGQKEEIPQDNFEADLSDPRFKEVFEDHDFAIDPTSSEFKGTNTMKKILKERSNRKQNGKKKRTSDKESKGELTSLVEKIKRRKK
ncbi:hypothetical protein PGUG_04418 [Meyerozyma guilliermondii ATCC 6260]|uniref:Uncharacterized protein n=1 Tax=Meyerozyma guilliermondii (strain ATCC 6260 / CBS 566 / DSM 6381 / JCM 1539 / NBRC 10279 / NRRL Y-324) TaxID=294746 RepID=A5DMB7_PICGU|nr:uncharacterized protein PGUG_04418 [Meyerozyma guilliermondii ATCC 6260]EDK40320.2 hypothetical protein PGUG_04418 [Meyerozyma guilliermondii ATCC 6260]